MNHLAWFLGLAMCTSLASAAVPPNILVVVADDLGTADVAGYKESLFAPATPTLDSLAKRGVLFRNAWSNPVCSPTRATVQTGRYSFRTGIGFIVDDPAWALQPGELTLPEMVSAGTQGHYENAAFGKWHLGPIGLGSDAAPNLAGYTHFAGNMTSINDCCNSYFDWIKVTDGVAVTTTTYNTSDTVDDASAWIQSQTKPWFCHLAFNAPHFPYHAPPPGLHSVNLSGLPTPSVMPRPYYLAMIESLDTELGRLLATIGPAAVANTVIIFLGDNGTPSEVMPPGTPAFHGKPSLFEAGINVPLIVAGPGVKRGECRALVNTSDIFATIAELTAADLTGMQFAGSLDSVSLMPYLKNPKLPSLRPWVFAEIFDPNGITGPYTFTGQAIRNDRYKYIRSSVLNNPLYADAFFDLLADPGELNNLLATGGSLTPNQGKNYLSLRRSLDDLLNSGP